MSSALATKIREELVSREGVQRIAPVRRGTVIYGPDAPADSVYFVDSGYVKLVKRGDDGKEVMLAIIGPGNIFGEQALHAGTLRTSSAQMLQEGAIYQVPRSIFLAFADSSPDVWKGLCDMLARRQQEMEQKISLLCLHDVEYRILYYVATLATMFGLSQANGQEFAIPLSQSELAHLIGATRETTSTTLNNLARRGLLRLGRRLLIVNSTEAVKAAVREKTAAAKSLAAAQNG